MSCNADKQYMGYITEAKCQKAIERASQSVLQNQVKL